MGLLGSFMQSRMQKAIQNDPQTSAFINSINSVGVYNGSSSSQEKADLYYGKLAMINGDYNNHVKNLYDSLLNSTNLPIPLVAIYAFAKGRFLDDPDFEPYNLNSQGAKDNAMSMKMLFPDYARFVSSRHYGTEEIVMLCLSSNLMNDIL